MKNFTKYLAFVVAIVLMASCKTTKDFTKELNGPNPERARFETVIANNYKYEALQSKVKLSMGKSSLNGKICIESGKRFCLSVNAPLLGFEVARIEASRDSVILVDKMDKVYSVISLGKESFMEALDGHEAEALECLMLGRIFIPGKGQATSKDYALLSWSTPKNSSNEAPISTGIYKGKNYQLAYSINAQGQLMNTSLTTNDGKRATWQYATFETIDKKTVATAENIIANSGAQKLEAGISFSNPTFGESTWRDFEANSTYRRVTLQELGEIFKNLTK